MLFLSKLKGFQDIAFFFRAKLFYEHGCPSLTYSLINALNYSLIPILTQILTQKQTESQSQAGLFRAV